MTIFLHIGSPKTGTTSIQRFFAANHALLRNKGFLYPKFAGPENHTKLAAYAHQQDFHHIELRLGISSEESRRAYRKSFAQLFHQRLAAVKENIIFSGEHCAAILNTEEEIGRLHDLLAGLKHKIKIIFYARQQADFLVSQYSTNIVNGRTSPLVYPTQTNLERNFDYYGLLRRWEAVFGREAIIARVFDRSQLAGGDVVQDICEVIGLDWAALSGATRPPRLNESLDHETIEFLRHFNAYAPPVIDRALNPDRGNFAGLVQQISGKEKIGIPQEIAQRLRKEMLERNSLLRERYLDGVKADPFTWDEASTPRPVKELSLDDAFRLFAKVWALKLAEQRQKAKQTAATK